MKSNIQSNWEEILDTITIEEVFEINDLTPVAALTILEDLGEIKKPQWAEIDTPIELDEEIET